jgi:hypothetical protein
MRTTVKFKLWKLVATSRTGRMKSVSGVMTHYPIGHCPLDLRWKILRKDYSLF